MSLDQETRRVSPCVDPSIVAFDRDLPELLRTNSAQWVAYHGGQRIGFGRSQTELIKRCIGHSLPAGEFIIRYIGEAALADHEEVEFP